MHDEGDRLTAGARTVNGEVFAGVMKGKSVGAPSMTVAVGGNLFLNGAARGDPFCPTVGDLVVTRTSEGDLVCPAVGDLVTTITAAGNIVCPAVGDLVINAPAGDIVCPAEGDLTTVGAAGNIVCPAIGDLVVPDAAAGDLVAPVNEEVGEEVVGETVQTSDVTFSVAKHTTSKAFVWSMKRTVFGMFAPSMETRAFRAKQQF